MRRVVAGLAPHRADLIEEEGGRAQLVQNPTGEVAEHLVPERGVGAHRRLVARELSVTLVHGLPIGAGEGVRTRQRETEQVRAPHPSLRVRHRLLPQRTDVLQAIPRAGLLGEVLRVVDVVQGMLPGVPMDPGRRVRKHLLGAHEDIGDVVRPAVDVEPQRYLRHATGIVGTVEDPPLGGPLRRERPGPVPARGLPPVIADGGNRRLETHAAGGQSRATGVFDRRADLEVVLLAEVHGLDARLGVVYTDVEPRALREERHHHRIVGHAAELVVAFPPRGVPHKARTSV